MIRFEPIPRRSTGVSRQRGVVLLLTIIFLVILSGLAYTVCVRIGSLKREMRYQIDYAQARYGCDSAVKYALTLIDGMKTPLIARPNEPDFSDVFAMDDEELDEMLAEWTEHLREMSGTTDDARDRQASDPNDPNDPNRSQGPDVVSMEWPPLVAQEDISLGPEDIRGPYGPLWPNVIEPLVLEIGDAKVTVEMHDENAKYPIAWMLIDDEQTERERTAGFEIVLEWMQLDVQEVSDLQDRLFEMKQARPFQLEFKPIAKASNTRQPPKPSARATRGAQSRIPGTTGQRTISVNEQMDQQNLNFTRLINSALADVRCLTRPSLESRTRRETARRYITRTPAQQVNINTAPRHVLEAAFAFGGQYSDIAEAIITRRREQPYADLEELKKELTPYADAIEKSREYLTTTSRFFTIRISAQSGSARVSKVIVLTRQGEKFKKVIMFSV